MVVSDIISTSRHSRRRSMRRSKKEDFQSKFALIMTTVTLSLMVLLSAMFHDSSKFRATGSGSHQQYQLNPDSEQGQHQRRLAEDDNTDDYSAFSCHYLYEQTPDPGSAQCQFARTCGQGEGLWAPFVFCRNGGWFSTNVLVALLSPVIVLWMVLLFRMLGSTAEDYFSPALEMFSVKLRMPPRFAGVTLLALGNGAADVSATISSITGDAENGYKLSLGALTGAAMVIGGVVSALVVLVAGGVPCRGALVRDVSALLIAVVVVWSQLRKGVVGPEVVSLFLSLYSLFVLMVLVADVYHRAVVLPRLAVAAREAERRRQLQEQQLAEAAMEDNAGANPASGDGTSTLTASPSQSSQNYQSENLTTVPLPPQQEGTSHLSNVMTYLSNYDNTAEDTSNGNGTTAEPDVWGVDSDDLRNDRPIMLHGAHGILTGDGRLASNEEQQHAEFRGVDYSILEDVTDRGCTDPNSAGVPAANWSGAVYDCKQEMQEHAADTWEDIVWNGDVNAVEKFLLLCELPFTLLRKASVPIPCEGYYCRAVIAASLALSPFWFVFYLWKQHDTNIFAEGNWLYFLLYWLACTVSGVLVMRYAPGGTEGNMSLYCATPIAMYGFIIAATWIDEIAGALVSLLNFIGIIFRIPGTIIGLTILAWGNSMGDLSANLTMARKGLANMAMTACFAGPVFNILVGLGMGFGSLAAKTGESERAVSLSPPVVTGFLFIALNSITILTAGLFVGKGKIPVSYGWVALTLYIIYLVTSISLSYSNKDDGNG